MLKQYLKYYTRQRAVIVVSAVVLLLFVWWLWPSSKVGADVITVVNGTITQEVAVTGGTKPGQNVEMSFDRSGRIVSASAVVGDHVYAGQVLASLDSGDLHAQLDQGLAELEALKKGARPEDIGVTAAAANSAVAALVQALQSSYNQADDAVRNLSDQLFDNPGTNLMLLKIDPGTYDDHYYDRQDVYKRRNQIEASFDSWKSLSQGLSNANDPATAYNSIYSNLLAVRDYLDKLSVLINIYTPTATNPAATLSGYRTNVAAARAEINASLSSVISANQSYETAKDQLVLKTAPPTTEAVAAKEAQLNGIRAQVRKNMIISPIGGLLTRQDAVVGETASPGVNMVTVMSSGSFLIEANVPEVDVGKLLVGNPVNLTLDAFPGENWTGKVIYIEPAETIVDGVVDYKIKVSIDGSDPRLKSGLTANLNIITAKKDKVLILPQYAIVENDQGSFVEKITGQTIKEVPVKLGIRSQDGNVEILSGVAAGDRVQNIGLKKK